jgi:hypothetical protein
VSFWSAEIRALTFDIFGSVVDWRWRLFHPLPHRGLQ